MSSILSALIDLDKLDESKVFVGDNGKRYLAVSIFVNDEPNKFGQNVSVAYSQSKEERDNKEKKVYVGNGKVVFTDGKIKVIGGAKKSPLPKNKEVDPEKYPNNSQDGVGETDDLPW